MDEYENQKKVDGKFATIVWIGISIYLLTTSQNSPGLVSFPGIGFILIGMFFAAIVFGLVAYLLQRAVAKLSVALMKSSGLEPSKPLAVVIVSVGYILTALNAVLIYIAANFTFNTLFG